MQFLAGEVQKAVIVWLQTLAVDSYNTGRQTLVYRYYNCLNIEVGAKGDWDFRISDLVKKNPDGSDI